jgi:hypothetical protein
MSNSTSLATSLDPHGYHPVIVGEDCLDETDRKQALVAGLAQPRDWNTYLTAQERDSMEAAVAEIERCRSPFCMATGESTESKRARAGMAQLGLFRWFARSKYSNGQEIHYGDRVPWLS